VELRRSPGIGGAAETLALAEKYLDALPLSPSERSDALSALRRPEATTDPSAPFAQLQKWLARDASVPDPAAYASVHRRVELALARGGAAPDATRLNDTDRLGRERLLTTPPLHRSTMVPNPWPPGPVARVLRWFAHPLRALRPVALAGPPGFPEVESDAAKGQARAASWHRAASMRRFTLLALVISQTIVATHFMGAVLPYHGGEPLEIALLVLFAILFGWVSAGFWTAMAGFALQVAGADSYAISRTADGRAPIDPAARTAIVMPICNEDVPRVFAGLRATYESLAAAGELEHFDFFVLSDSGNPDLWVGEVAAWLDLCRAVNGFGRVFYRRRQHRIKRKSGNIADFCRRWGVDYRYMVVLDADSVMSGDCLSRLVRIAEANPTSGIIQTAPRAAGRDSMYARMQQFASDVYGPLFTAGLHFWQLGESHYWGHNAIIRTAPFMRYCALGRLPGRGALSGEILSHDFVEAALMRRAGWSVWIAYDLPGSYEEMPPNLIDELKRDRRWCQGNLMNFRLFLMKGLHPAHRAVFMTGVMTYLSAPLWFAFLILTTVVLAVQTLLPPTYFIAPYQLFPLWPEWHPEWAIALFGATSTLLFLPKIMGAVLLAGKGARLSGGVPALFASTFLEMVMSALLAPIRMLFHTRFVLLALLGWSVSWKSPPRADNETSWREALSRHGLHTLLGLAWAAGVYWLDPSYLWWLLPVVGALILSIPLSVYTSRVSLGRRLRQALIFLTPEEVEPPGEIRATRKYLTATRQPPAFAAAVADPLLNALVCASGVARARLPERLRKERAELARYALLHGPQSLSAAQKAELLGDPIALSLLHEGVWSTARAHALWNLTV
jgi:membrane glycosyltransferase